MKPIVSSAHFSTRWTSITVNVGLTHSQVHHLVRLTSCCLNILWWPEFSGESYYLSKTVEGSAAATSSNIV